MKFTLEVDGMTCSHCMKAVTAAIRALDGEAKVEIDLAARLVQVDGQVPPDEASRAIREAGYAVSDLAQ